MNNKLALFEEKEIRKIYKNNKWYYSIIDVIEKYSNAKDPKQYLQKIKLRDPELQTNWNKICILLNMHTKDGKIRKTQVADTIGILRIIESISSEKVEPIKMWLAKIGSDRLDEISAPELAMDRMKEIYKKKGYSDIWIEQREREITSRHSLKEEWHKRGIEKNKDYMLLNNEIYKSSFGIDIDQYKNIKGIQDSSILKDSMTNIELAIMNLSETIAIEIHRKKYSRGLEELNNDILQTGKIIATTKNDIEHNLEKNIVSSENYMNLIEEYKELD